MEGREASLTSVLQLFATCPEAGALALLGACTVLRKVSCSHSRTDDIVGVRYLVQKRRERQYVAVLD